MHTHICVCVYLWVLTCECAYLVDYMAIYSFIQRHYWSTCSLCVDVDTHYSCGVASVYKCTDEGLLSPFREREPWLMGAWPGVGQGGWVVTKDWLLGGMGLGLSSRKVLPQRILGLSRNIFGRADTGISYCWHIPERQRAHRKWHGAFTSAP